jgi:hypothetical protein
MKNSIRVYLALLLVQSTMLSAGGGPPVSSSPADFPKKVSEILTNSCYECHTTGSKVEKAWSAMDFNKWEGYKLTKKISLLTKICEIAEKGEMPPEKYLKLNPDKALTESEVKTICNWTKKESEKLIK